MDRKNIKGQYCNVDWDIEFWKKVIKTRNCWIWQGHLQKGYGRFGDRGKRIWAHRFAYEKIIGEIPNGKVLDHLCRNPRCVNPYHLEPISSGENILRGIGPCAINRRKTHCSKGHQYSIDNTYYRKTGGRGCKECVRNRSREWQRKKRNTINI